MGMGLFMFLFTHLLVGLVTVYLWGKLPKAKTTFMIVFLSMSIIYVTVVFSSAYF